MMMIIIMIIMHYHYYYHFPDADYDDNDGNADCSQICTDHSKIEDDIDDARVSILIMTMMQFMLTKQMMMVIAQICPGTLKGRLDL